MVRRGERTFKICPDPSMSYMWKLEQSHQPHTKHYWLSQGGLHKAAFTVGVRATCIDNWRNTNGGAAGRKGGGAGGGDRYPTHQRAALSSGSPTQKRVSMRNSWYRLISPVSSGSKSLKTERGRFRYWAPCRQWSASGGCSQPRERSTHKKSALQAMCVGNRQRVNHGGCTDAQEAQRQGINRVSKGFYATKQSSLPS
jgi:hypothetical protein